MKRTAALLAIGILTLATWAPSVSGEATDPYDRAGLAEALHALGNEEPGPAEFAQVIQAHLEASQAPDPLAVRLLASLSMIMAVQELTASMESGDLETTTTALAKVQELAADRNDETSQSMVRTANAVLPELNQAQTAIQAVNNQIHTQSSHEEPNPTIWTSANDGEGSHLDADFLDGLSSQDIISLAHQTSDVGQVQAQVDDLRASTSNSLDEVDARLVGLNSDLEAQANALDGQEAALTDLGSELRAADDSITEQVEVNHQAAMDGLAAASAAMDAMDEDLGDLASRFDDHAQVVADGLQAAKAARADLATRLTDAMEARDAALRAELDAAVAALDADIAVLQDDLEELDLELAALESSLSQRLDLVDDVLARLDAADRFWSMQLGARINDESRARAHDVKRLTKNLDDLDTSLQTAIDDLASSLRAEVRTTQVRFDDETTQATAVMVGGMDEDRRESPPSPHYEVAPLKISAGTFRDIVFDSLGGEKGQILQQMTGLPTPIVEAIEKLIDLVVSKVNSAFRTLVSYIESSINTAMSTLVDEVNDIFEDIEDTLGGRSIKVGEFVDNVGLKKTHKKLTYIDGVDVRWKDAVGITYPAGIKVSEGSWGIHLPTAVKYDMKDVKINLPKLRLPELDSPNVNIRDVSISIPDLGFDGIARKIFDASVPANFAYGAYVIRFADGAERHVLLDADAFGTDATTPPFDFLVPHDLKDVHGVEVGENDVVVFITRDVTGVPVPSPGGFSFMAMRTE